VKEASHAVHAEYNGKQNLVTRVGDNSEPLDMNEATDYIRDKWS